MGILLRSGCSPSMSVEQTPGPMGTGRSSMKEDARSCGQNYWNLSGKKSSMSGQRGQRQDFQNGLVNVLVKRLVMQKHLKGMKKQLLKKKMRARNYLQLDKSCCHCFHTKKKFTSAPQPNI